MKTFIINGEEYRLRTYSDEEVCKYVFNNLGCVADKMTVYEYTVLKFMLNNGFTPTLSFYGRPTGELYPQAMWYSFIGLREDGAHVDFKLCCKLSYDADKEAKESIVVYEGGERCFTCYRKRLTFGYDYAEEHGFDYFGTVMSISRYKNSQKLNGIGINISK